VLKAKSIKCKKERKEKADFGLGGNRKTLQEDKKLSETALTSLMYSFILVQCLMSEAESPSSSGRLISH